MKKELLSIILSCYSVVLFAQTKDNYTKQWQDIDSLIVVKDLPKTALDKVNTLYADAKKNGAQDEILRALLYKLSLQNKTSDADINVQVAAWKEELKTTGNEVTKAVINMRLASDINFYYEENVWKNSRREETIGYKEADINTWSNPQLVQTIDSLYSAALSQEQLLRQTSVAYLNAILIKGNSKNTRPTLYDLITHEELDYYKKGLAYVTAPTYTFTLNDAHALADAGTFMQYSFSSSRDTVSHFLKAVKLFQQLLLFHAKDADPTAFIDADLERIQWVNYRLNNDNKELLYTKALYYITNRFPSTKSTAEAWYFLAKTEADKAASYNPLTDTANRFGYVNAKAIIEERLKAMPDSCLGNNEMKSLLEDIIIPELNTQAESVNVANAPFRLLIRYKNIDTLYAHILLQKELDKAEKKKAWSEWRDIGSLPFIKMFQQVLPQTNDYQTHVAEIKADALPPGDYVILFSNSTDFSNKKDKLATQAFTVSNLAYLRSNEDYFVVDRESGQPTKGVKVTGTFDVENYKNNKPATNKTGTLYTDSSGHFKISIDRKKYNYHNVNLTFKKGDDILRTSDNLYAYRYSNNNEEEKNDSDYEEDNSQVYFFTDRSIYRPGQTVWYKGIVTTKNKKTGQLKLYHYTDTVEVNLYDANAKVIDSQFVQLNEYGSFSGKFSLPQNVLTGDFSIETVDFDKSEIHFNVEEYKRPTFYIAFDTLKDSYRLNDTITLTGSAKAYAGNAVDNAKVNYHIQRSASFLHPYLFWNKRRAYSNEAEIADSTININAEGNFTIRFAATPDAAVDKETEPVFSFKIELSVTDANGETREANTTIHVGYKAIQLQVNAPEVADVRNFKNLFITTKNNADENIPAKVNITISPLQTPAKAYRKRLWQQPDQFTMSKETFAAYFPYDEYESETDYHQWKKEQVVLKDTFNTASTAVYKLPAAGLPQGWYCIEATTKDKDGSEVKDVRYVQLYDMDAPGLPAPQINFSQVISSSGTTGDKAQLLVGTSEKDVFAITQIKKNETGKEADSFGYVRLNNNKRKVDYIIRSNDFGNIGLYYAFIKHNSFYTGGMQVYVNRGDKHLNITYATYRNKTEPGSKETWTVQVTDSSNKKVAAELLTSMYDASLDQFKKQQWEVPYFNAYSYVNNDWSGGDFETMNSDENSYPYTFYSLEKEYEHFAKSASELWEIYERYRRIRMLQFTPPKIATDKEDMNLYRSGYFDSNKPEERLAGRALGISTNQAGNLSEVVVTGYGTSRKKDMAGSVSAVSNQSLSDTSFFNMKVRGLTQTSNLNDVLIVIDGVITDKKISELDAGNIDHIDVLKGSEATALYGAKATNGVIVVTTKDFMLRSNKKKEDAPQIQIRKNFSETAFFFPQLHADSSGNYSFSFTMPDAVTTWKWMSLAHTKEADFGYKEQSIITQKILMVQPNLPRFLREGDSMEITAKISNLSDSAIKGTVTMQLLDGLTNLPLNDSFATKLVSQSFSTGADRSTTTTFSVNIPRSYTRPITVKIIAAANRYSDGEENTLPVLSNRQLITETLPLYMQDGGTKHFTFSRLVNNHSASLTNESLTVEYTTNPAWYVVQSLPYLMQFPHECAEQTFNRFYANVLAAYIVAKHPQIKEVFNAWMKDSASLQSNLETNPGLKNILLNETPWVKDAESETQQKRNIAMLFDTMKLNTSMASALQQLKELQMSNGAFSWFKGGYADRYITQYIITGIGKLNKLHAITPEAQNTLNEIALKALRYADKEEQKDYTQLIKDKANLTNNNLTETAIQYWYMRSFFNNNRKEIAADAFNFFVQQAEQYRSKQSPYMQGMMALALNRLLPVTNTTAGFTNMPSDIVHSLKENAVTDTAKGMYWKDNQAGYYWYQSPLEAQALLIDAFKEIAPADSAINAMLQWLILNKQTNHWQTTKATADACYALLSNQSLDSSEHLSATLQLGDSIIHATNENTEAGSGYIKQRINGKEVNSSMGNISVLVTQPTANNHSSRSSYGAVYWQYFEDMDKITGASSPLYISKKLFIEKNSDKGKILQPLTGNNSLKVGDKLVIQLIIKSDRDMDYIQLTDTRAASMEPVNVISEYKWKDGLGYYESTKDAATNFFFDHLAKGTYVLDYPVFITHAGNYSAGVATLQCMYAPQFAAHSGGERIQAEPLNQQK